MQDMPDEQMQRLYELYMEDCTNKHIKSSMSDFITWLEDEGYEY